ncbi:adiponectin receptor protein 1 [Thecamonas trahens ATCC 50062]|uniref:Adiponectin receptor protein 1 n=1 Tax=Thecamonas trahens ATCC 50062 TaxID=461836 RepID=A0A0L0DU40_THETB|nr:adiponectin receptor protein 1 [Thecamonas trahens ATCC 50062]KNC55003.1 adiponectin receptor protein 1 [Thecamonas trahens ATCC 50062]|eukprot:XP_013753446.1 adiponectin receptor protein 1 [Thecamonas trahens ATCC 50062]
MVAGDESASGMATAGGAGAMGPTGCGVASGATVADAGGDKDSAGRTVLFDGVELGSYDESPLWVRVNPFVISGYRLGCASMAQCMRSVWYLHNQTMNVWTHAGGTVVVAVMLALRLAAHIRDVGPLSWLDAALVGVFIFAFASQFLLSAAYHAVMCHSADVCFRFRQWDYIGVLFHIGGLELVALVGLFVPPAWLGAADRGRDLVPAATLVSAENLMFVAAFGCVVTVVLVWTISMLVLQPHRKYRIYVGMVLLTALSWALIWRLYAVDAPVAAQAAQAMWDVQKWYAIGMVPFLYKVPERWIPTGLFDIWGASHQLWHIAIILGTFNELELLMTLL